MKSLSLAVVAALACSLSAPLVGASVLLYDPLSGSGTLAGSEPATGTGTWTTYAATEGSSYQADQTGAGFVPSSGIAAVDGTRGAAGVNVGSSARFTSDGAYIPLTGVTSPITAQVAVNFSSTAAAVSNPTAWAFLGLTTSLNQPDVLPVGLPKSVGPWMLVRPSSNGVDTVELYATASTTVLVATSTIQATTDGSHELQLLFDPVAGTLNAVVDNIPLLSTPYSYGGSNPAIPVIDGFIMGDRTNSQAVSVANPSSATLSYAEVYQTVPEPASLAVMGVGMMALAGHRVRRGIR